MNNIEILYYVRDAVAWPGGAGRFGRRSLSIYP